MQQNAQFTISINFAIKCEGFFFFFSRKARVTRTKEYNMVSINFIFKMSAPLFLYISQSELFEKQFIFLQFR